MTRITAAIRAGVVVAAVALTPADAAALDPGKAIAQYVHMVWGWRSWPAAEFRQRNRSDP
jgi:hypothetical protein